MSLDAEILAAMATAFRRSDGTPVLLNELRVARHAFLRRMLCQHGIRGHEIPANGRLYVVEWTSGSGGETHVSLSIKPRVGGTLLGKTTYGEVTGLAVVH